MSLGRSKKSYEQRSVRGSRSDFRISSEWVTKEESGLENFEVETLRSDIAEDLRKIGGRYDQLVLKMFNQRSNVRNDVMLLKKEAKALRNEMKFLIMKHDNSTAFKKGYLPESHEMQRFVKAENVTKEMEQLEVTFADLMSKYYYLLEQTKTLKEINSLWHIRSVMKSDLLRKNAKVECVRPSEVQVGKQGIIIDKKTEEIKSENSKLVQKVRWLTKLSHEFRADLTDLLSAKVALINGKASLQKQYDALLKESDATSESKLLTSEEDFRQAEIRIIDGLNRRIAALDRISDALKAAIVKVSIEGLKNPSKQNDIFDNNEHLKTSSNHKIRIGNEAPVESTSNVNEFKQRRSNQYGSTEEQETDSTEEVEEVQARFVRLEDVDEDDFKCLSPRSKRNFTLYSESGMLYGQLRNCKEHGPMTESSTVLVDSGKGAETVCPDSPIIEGGIAPSLVCQLAETSIERTDSDVTLTEEINFQEDINEESVKTRDVQLNDITNEQEQQGTPGEAQKTANRIFNGSNNTFNSELKSKLEREQSKETSSEEQESKPLTTEEIDSGLETWEQRFSKAKTFFESQCQPDVKEIHCKDDIIIGCPPESDQIRDEKISCVAGQEKISERELKEISNSTEIIETREEIKVNTNVIQKKGVNPEDRPVFYDPNGTWKSTGTASRSSSRVGTYDSLKRRPKIKSNPDGKKDKENFTSQTLPRSLKKSQKQDGSSIPSNLTVRRRGSLKQNHSDESSCKTLPRNIKSERNESRAGMVKTAGPLSRPVSQLIRRQSVHDRNLKTQEGNKKDYTIDSRKHSIETSSNSAEFELPMQANTANKTSERSNSSIEAAPRTITQLVRRQSSSDKSSHINEGINIDPAASTRKLSLEKTSIVVDSVVKSSLPKQTSTANQPAEKCSKTDKSASRPNSRLVRRQSLSDRNGKAKENNNTDLFVFTETLGNDTVNIILQSSAECSHSNQSNTGNQTSENINVTESTPRLFSPISRQQSLKDEVSKVNNNNIDVLDLDTGAPSSETTYSDMDTTTENGLPKIGSSELASTQTMADYPNREETPEYSINSLPRRSRISSDCKAIPAPVRRDSHSGGKPTNQVPIKSEFSTLPRHAKKDVVHRDTQIKNNNKEYNDSTLKKNKKKLLVRKRKPNKEGGQESTEDRKTIKKVERITGKAASWMQSAFRFVSADSKANGKNLSKTEPEKEIKSRPVSTVNIEDFKRPASSLSGKSTSTDHRKSMIPIPAVY